MELELSAFPVCIMRNCDEYCVIGIKVSWRIWNYGVMENMELWFLGEFYSVAAAFWINPFHDRTG